MPKRGTTAIFVPLGFLWIASLLLYGLLRLFLVNAYGLPFLSPGFGALLALLLAASWALVEEPVLGPGAVGRLLKLWAALACFVGGEALIYPLVNAKDRLSPLALGLMGAGALLLLPRRGPWAKLGAAAALGLGALGLWSWGHPDTAGMDLVAGPVFGNPLPIAAWGLLLLGGFSLLALAQQAPAPAALGGAGLPRRREAWLLLAVLGLGALMRLPQMGAMPEGIWYDEVNLSRATEDRVLDSGQAPLYVGEQVENPGAYLWVGAAVFKVFGRGVLRYRFLAAFFGFLALFPFWGLARLWFGGRWALVATALFGVMRWTLIPQRIGFMSGFALFWMLAAFWAFWFQFSHWDAKKTKGSRENWRWVLAGALAACNLYTYTPGRFVPLILAAFLGLELLARLVRKAPWNGLLKPIGWMALGFAMLAAPMLFYIATHWAVYALRSSQVSIFADAARSGTPIARELWSSASRHLLMFNLRGDFNARHNLHFYPQVDLLSASALGLGLPWALGRFFKDARSRFMALWLAFMLCAGIFTLAVEAPQGHRTILAAPLLALAIVWAVKDLLAPLGTAFVGGWPRSALVLGLALLLSVAAFNAYEVYGLWAHDSETWRSFSPFASAAVRRAQASDPSVQVYISPLSQEYEFHGYELGQFMQYFLRPNRSPQTLRLNSVLSWHEGASGILMVWGESDREFSEAFAWEFPGIPLEKPANPYPTSGEPNALYLAAEVPLSRIPYERGLRRPFLIAREGAP